MLYNVRMDLTAKQYGTEEWPDIAEGQLSVDIFETDKDIIVQSTVAGVSPKELDIFVNADMLTIRGKRTRDMRASSATTHYEECFWGAFSRTIVLPAHVKAGETKADLKDGVLTITLPKETSTGVQVPIG
jgi:HSP20 family protein